MEKIKLDEKEINEIKELRKENSKMAVDFGRVRLDMILVKGQLTELEKMDSDMEARFKGNRTKEKKIVEKLNKKYGAGTIDIDSGEFTPTEVKDGESK
tara:strand:+ start:194 stop:487 length:294 start_codon:yes stop_codon:yes gene_type:complete